MSNGRVENRIDYVELPATDLERTKQFYSGVFGWGGRRFHFADPNGNVLAVWSDVGV